MTTARSAPRVDRGLAAERPEQLLRREVGRELVGVELGARNEAERDIADRFGKDSPDAEHHARSELRIAHEPRDQLAIAAHHRRDEHLDRAVLRASRGEQFRGRVAHARGVAEVEPHEPAFGLVRDRVAAQLHDNGIAERVGGLGRGVGRRDGALVEHRHAVLREQRLRRGFGEGRHGGRG